MALDRRGVGYITFNNWYGYTPYRSSTVIVREPTVVYVNDSAPVSTRYTQPPARSLLRDINGNCFERTYDSRGVETRVRLPDSACRF